MWWKRKDVESIDIERLNKDVHDLKRDHLKSKYVGKTCFYILGNALMDFKVYDVDIFDDDIWLVSMDSFSYKSQYFDLLKNGYLLKHHQVTGICRINQSIIE